MSRVLFWDFDGVLVHSGSLWGIAMQDVLLEFRYDIELNAVREHLRTGFSWHTPDKAYPDRTGPLWWEDLFPSFDAFHRKIGLTPEQSREACREIRRKILDPHRYTLYGDAMETLKACRERGDRCYILSNNYPELEQVAAGLGLTPYLDGVVTSGLVGYEKPRIELFRHALELAGKPEEAWMIGDNPKSDILGGRQAGMGTIQVHNPAPSEADYVCGTLAEVLAAVR